MHAAAAGFEAELATELGPSAVPLGGGLFATLRTEPAAWARCSWLEPVLLPIASIGDASQKLRSIQRNWTLYPTASVRRARLIEEKLPPLRGKELTFPEAPPSAPIGAWTLLDRDLLLASARTDRPTPHGLVRFVENKDEPPSRAYLKLWEALTLLGARPGPGERCLDLGASPGGWTWVCASLGASVLSVDKAPLAPHVAAMPEVETRQQSAFGLAPRAVGPVDWVLSDVICYPERLLGLVRSFLEAGVGTRYVCTLKFQGETDHATARAFATIPGGRLVHLSHNKHELTWLWQHPGATPSDRAERGVVDADEY